LDFTKKSPSTVEMTFTAHHVSVPVSVATVHRTI